MKKRVSRYDESCNIPVSHIVGEIGCNFASSKQSKTLIISDMKLFSIFRKNNTSSPVLETVVPPTTREVSESPAIPASDPSGKIVSITYGTGMPIDVLYAFINKDYEQEGYQDALVNTDAEYCTAKESIILNKLQQLSVECFLDTAARFEKSRCKRLMPNRFLLLQALRCLKPVKLPARNTLPRLTP